MPTSRLARGVPPGGAQAPQWGGQLYREGTGPQSTPLAPLEGSAIGLDSWPAAQAQAQRQAVRESADRIQQSCIALRRLFLRLLVGQQLRRWLSDQFDPMTAHTNSAALETALLPIARCHVHHPTRPVMLIRLHRVHPWIRVPPSSSILASRHPASIRCVNGFHRCHLPHPPRQPHVWQSVASSSVTKRLRANRPGRCAPLALRRFLMAFRRIERFGITHLPREATPCTRWRSAEDRLPVRLAPPRMLPRALHQLHRLTAVRTLHLRTTFAFA